MSKLMLGLAIGAALGLVDGFAAWIYPPETHPGVRGDMTIVYGSTFKGLLTGVIAGAVALRKRSLALGVTAGLLAGLVLSFLVAAMPMEDGSHYWIEIMLPGAALGAVCGFATLRYGRPAGARGAAPA